MCFGTKEKGGLQQDNVCLGRIVVSVMDSHSCDQGSNPDQSLLQLLLALDTRYHSQTLCARSDR